MKCTDTIIHFVANGRHHEALALYIHRLRSSSPPDAFTFPFLLKSCANLQSLPRAARQVHDHVIKFGFESRMHTATALIDAYMKFGQSGDAVKVFESIPHPTVPCYNAVIAGFARRALLDEVRDAFRDLRSEGLCPNSVTIASLLPSCGSEGMGLQLHGYSMKLGHDVDDYVETALQTMYLNLGDLDSAKKVFSGIQRKTVVSYNAMISGLVKNSAFFAAFDLFKQMTVWFRPNLSTFLSVISVCSELSALHLGKQVHCQYLKCESGYDVKIGSALLSMYLKCDAPEHGHQVFAEMDNKNLVSWNSMISGLLSKGCVIDAVSMFQKLKAEGFLPDMATWNIMISGFSRLGNASQACRFFRMMHLEGIHDPNLECITSLLQVCSSISDLRFGKEIHGHLVRTRANCVDEVLLTTLIHMYMKCGFSIHARRIFDQTKPTDPTHWNALISGYARNGNDDDALEMFRKMQDERVKPNASTFLACLSACSHAGEVEEGIEVFRMMIRRHGIKPNDKHISCMIDMLSRAGKTSEAWDLLHHIPKPSVSLYSSLLGACGCYVDLQLGKKIAEKLSQIDPRSPTSLVILSNIYAGYGRWDDVERLRNIIEQRKLYKRPGCSQIRQEQFQLP